MRTLPDSELIELARLDDRAAFMALLHRYDDGMRALAYRLLLDRAAVDDVLHEAYLAAHRTLDRVRPVGDARGWLLRRTYNACVDVLKAEDADLRRDEDEDDDGAAVGPLHRALRDLPVDQRVSLMLVDGEGFSSAEVAGILGVGARSVASRLGRARASVRATLEAASMSEDGAGSAAEASTDDLARAAADGGADGADTLVQATLRGMTIPAHAPGFWEDLEAAVAEEPRRVAAEPSLAVGPGGASTQRAGTAPDRARQRFVASPEAATAAAAASRGADPTRHLVPPSLRRTSNLVLLGLAIAAMVLVLVCGAVLLRSRGDAGLGPSPAGSSAAASSLAAVPVFATR